MVSGQPEVQGTLADGGSFRATSYLVEIRDPAGLTALTVDAKDIREVRRDGTVLTLKRAKGGDLRLAMTNLDDAGRTEALLRAPAPNVLVIKKGGGVRRFMMIGCGGLIGLLVLAGVIGAAAGGSKQKDEGATAKSGTAASGAGGTPASPAPKANEGLLAEGQATTAENAKVTIIAIQDPYVPKNQFSRPKAGNRFVAYKVQIEHTGQSGTVSANGFNFKLRDSENFQHQTASVVFEEQSLLGQAQSLASGTKIEGWVGFEVKEGVTVKELSYDPNPFTNTDNIFRAP